MEYSISQLARISGVSARTLRYYDEIALLRPKRINSSGYRIYGAKEVNLLQQILFYREIGINLEEIKAIIYAEDFNLQEALENHLLQLSQEKKRIERLMSTVNDSIQALKGERTMTDNEKFAAFKQELIDDNEQNYGQEIRAKYGEKTVNASNAKMANMTEEQWLEFQHLGESINQKLAIAISDGNPASELAQEVCELHRQWLLFSWPEGHYSPEKHYNLSLMYVHDERFKAYYDGITPGATEFLHKAIGIYTAMEN